MRRPLSFLLVLAIASCTLHAGEPPQTPLILRAQPIKAADKPFTAPGGAAQKGWDLFLKNDFTGAEAAFRETIKQEPKNLFALEGLRGCLVSVGKYKESQQVNLQMVEAAADTPLCGVFATRAIDSMGFVESRADVIATFTKVAAAAGTSAPAAAMLKDSLATLYYRVNKVDEARKSLEGLGYVNEWQFVAGPFGSKDKNNPIERRYAPERALGSLEFQNEDGKKIQVHKNVKVAHRELNLDTFYPGAKGIFYAFSNLESDSDQDVVIGISAPPPCKLYLRGMPVLNEPEDEQKRRAGGELIHTRLVKGSNPLLLKLSAATSVIVRIFAVDSGPVPGVRVKALDDAQLAAHTVLPLRGTLLAKKTNGASAEYFLKKYSTDAKDGREATLLALAEHGEMSCAEAVWLEIILQRENDMAARVAIARRLAGSFTDSVGILDHAAAILKNAGAAMGGAGQEDEESRQYREHALTIVPNSHQHLLAIHSYYLDHELVDKSFEKIKAAADAYPDSPYAQAELGQVYQRKQFYVEAEKCFEKAASLDNAYLYQLIAFHDAYGNRARASELRRKEIELGQLPAEMQFDLALRRGEVDQADKLLSDLEKAYPDRKDDWEQSRVRLLREKGDNAGAYALQKKLYEQTRFAANKRAVLIALVELALRLKKDDEAVALLKGYLKEHSGEVDLHERLSELEGKVLPRWWEPYDVKVPTIDTSAFTNEKYPASNHAWIVDFMVTKITPELSSESYVHIAQKVLNIQGINELSELLVRAQRQDMIFVRTLNPDGSAYQPQNVHDFNLAQSASLYKVGPGSILEHAYVMSAATDEDEATFTMGFNFNAIDAPRAVSRWVVMIPDAVKDKLSIRKIRGDMVDEKILPGPPGYTVYQWTNKQIEGIKMETLMPTDADQEVIPLVLVETPDRPFRANGWLMRREKNLLPPEAAAEAKRIVSDKSFTAFDDGRKFDAIVNWVRLNIKSGNESRTLNDVWSSRSGRSDQMTQLAHEMAQSVGLSTRMAFVNGMYVPGRVWHSKNAKKAWEPAELANFGSGGRMLVLEQPYGPDRWAQYFGRTPKSFNPSDLNYGQAGAIALSLGDDGVRVKRVRGETLGVTTAANRLDVALDAKGTGSVRGSLQLYGNVAGNWREALNDPRQSAQIKEYVIRFSWPKSQPGDVQVTGADQPELPLSFNYTCTVKGIGSQAGDALFITPFLSRVRLLDLRGPPERQHDILIKDELADLDHSLTYTAPEGYGWVEVPDDMFIVTEFGFYLVDYNVEGRKLTCTRSYMMPAQRITPEKYPKLLAYLSQISASTQQRIAYAPLKTESFGPYRHDIFSMGYASYGEDEKEKDKVEVEKK
jgi:tetratricopeptide (TPR) repeat protein